MPEITHPTRISLSDVGTTSETLVSQNFPRVLSGSQAAPSTQIIYAMEIPLRAGQVVTNMQVGVTTAASGTAPTLIKLALLDSTGKVLDQTANVNSDARFVSKGIKSFALPAITTYTMPADGIVYGSFLINGAFGTTNLQLGRTPVSLIDVVMGASIGGGSRPVANQSGQTDFAANNSSQTLVDPVSGSVFWFGLT